MIEHTLLAFWGVWLLLVFVAAFRVFGFLIARRAQDRLWGDGSGTQKPVALIVPVKGFDLQATPRFFDSIFAQNYGDYRVIVCFESWEDPVAIWLCEHLELNPRHPVWTHPDPESGLRGITLVCGGLSENEGQKVCNQRAAFRDLASHDAIIAFADADILCGSDWLAKLVAPINRGTHQLSTTYRWLIPKRPSLANQIACTINASVTTQGGREWSTVLWGGSMALAREVFDELNVPELLAGSVNDDLRISKAARATGRKIAFVRSLILPTPVDYTWRTFFEFVRRQYTQVKFFSPILYTGTNLVLGFYVLGAASIVAALVYGYFFAWVPVAAAYIIDQFRALARQQVYLSLFKENGIRQKLFAAGWLEHMLTPFWLALHWLLLASTWTQNRITWAGVRYRIFSKSRTRILQRIASPQVLPAGAPGLAMISALHDRRRDFATQPVRPAAGATQPIPTFTATSGTTEISITEATGALTEHPTAALPESVTVTSEADLAKSESAGVETIFISHPGAPSAVIPLTVSFHERPERKTRRILPKDRGCLSAGEAALGKTRALPGILFLEGPPRSITIPNRPEAIAPVPGPPGTLLPAAPRGRRITSVERALQKTRLPGAGAVPLPRKIQPSSKSVLPARIDRLSKKTRIPSKGSFLSPTTRPSTAVVSGPPGSTGRHSLRFPPLSGRSLAARRALPGCASHQVMPGRCFPTRSLKTAPGGRSNSFLHARPVSRGPSGRP